MEKNKKKVAKDIRQRGKARYYHCLKLGERQIINAITGCRRRHKGDPPNFQFSKKYLSDVLSSPVVEIRACNARGRCQKEFIIFKRNPFGDKKDSRLTTYFAEPGSLFSAAQLKKLRARADR